MGCCCSSENGHDTSDSISQEQRRQQILEAVEKRLKEQETRGIKNPESVKAKQERANAIDKAFDFNGPNDQKPLRWQVD